MKDVYYLFDENFTAETLLKEDGISEIRNCIKAIPIMGYYCNQPNVDFHKARARKLTELEVVKYKLGCKND